jgi:DinB family protein
MESDVRSVLSKTPSILRPLVEGASEAALQFHENEAAWSATQVLAHLAEAEITDWMPRLEVILSANDDKRFPPFDREAGFVRYAGWSPQALLIEFERLRNANLARLDDCDISMTDLHRTGVHPEFGPVTLAQLLACWATHDLAHINQISRSFVRHWGPRVGPWRKYYRLLSE